jgi:hypothetical protein
MGRPWAHGGEAEVCEPLPISAINSYNDCHTGHVPRVSGRKANANRAIGCWKVGTRALTDWLERLEMEAGSPPPVMTPPVTGMT